MLMPTTPPRNKHFMLPSRLPDTALSRGDTAVYCKTSSGWDYDVDTAVPQRNGDAATVLFYTTL